MTTYRDLSANEIEEARTALQSILSKKTESERMEEMIYLKKKWENEGSRKLITKLHKQVLNVESRRILDEGLEAFQQGRRP